MATESKKPNTGNKNGGAMPAKPTGVDVTVNEQALKNAVEALKTITPHLKEAAVAAQTLADSLRYIEEHKGAVVVGDSNRMPGVLVLHLEVQVAMADDDSELKTRVQTQIGRLLQETLTQYRRSL